MTAAFAQLNQGLPPPPCYSSEEEEEEQKHIPSCISPSSTIPIANNIKSPSNHKSQPILTRNKQFTIPINNGNNNNNSKQSNNINTNITNNNKNNKFSNSNIVINNKNKQFTIPINNGNNNNNHRSYARQYISKRNNNPSYQHNNNYNKNKTNPQHYAINTLHTPTQYNNNNTQIQNKNNTIRTKAINELIATEITYIKNLNTLINLYSIPLSQNRKLLSSHNHSIIFPNSIQSIIKLNTTLLKSMQSNHKYIGQSMLSLIPYLKMYENYMKNHEHTSQLLSKIRSSRSSNHTQFIKFLDNKKKETNGLTLESFLILPIQRIPRYELCLKEIIKYTNDTNLDKKNLIECYNKIKNVNMEINKKLKEYECRLKVHEIEKKINGLNFNLVTPSRYYIYDGFITKISRKKHIKYLFILFNDILIYCDADKNKNKLTFHRMLEMDEYFSIKPICYLDDSDGNSDKSKCYFEIRSLEKSFLCYADTVEEREKWIDLISKCLGEKKNQKRSDSYIRYRKSIHDIDSGRMLETAPIKISNNLANRCMMKGCNNKLGIIGLRKKYHCTYCGKIVCNECCKNMLEHFNPNKRGKKKRVCDMCWNEHKTPYLINVDQMNFVSKNIPINNNNDDIKDENDDDLWDKFEFQNNNCNTVNNNVNNDKMNDIFDGLFNENTNAKIDNNDPFADLWNQNKNNNIGSTRKGNNSKMVTKNKLDYNNENVTNLRMFGFCDKDIDRAWNLMKNNKNDKNIIPQNGELFVQKMLDYLQKVQKNKFTLNIM